MTRTTVIAALGALALVAGAGMAAHASPLRPLQVALSGRYSDSNMRWARRRIEQNIDMLQNDRRDYGGYRIRAIALMQEARRQITLGLAYDNGREDVAPPPGFVRPDRDMYFVRGERASDLNLALVRRNIDNIMDVLQRDNHDYGGHRVAALRLLAQSRQMLSRALAYDRTR
jgi:hypothetical protein